MLFLRPKTGAFPETGKAVSAYHPAFENAAQRRKWAKIAPKQCQNERLTETPGVLLFKAEIHTHALRLGSKMKGDGKCATNEQEAETGMGAVSERTKPNHLQRAMPEVSALMQAELPGIGDRLPAFFEKGEKTKMKLELIKASDVEIKEVEWLWYPYIPYGKVTVLQGDSGDGKSTFVLNLAAMLSRGEPMPFTDGSGQEPVNIIYQSSEDDADDTIVPRFVKAGGDPNRLIFISEKEKYLSFSDERLLEAVRKTNAKLIVLDPLSAYIGEETRINTANEIRRQFRPLIELAKEQRCAILIVHHMIERQKEKYGWEFLFLGANIDAAKEAARFGIDADRAVNYKCDEEGTALNYEVISAAVCSVRAAQPLSADWKRRIDEDVEKRGR